MTILRYGRITLFACAMIFLAAGNNLLADSTNLFPVADTTLRSSDPDSSYGGVSALPVGVSKPGSSYNRGLFKFDLTSLPTNAIISAVTVTFVVASDPTPAASFDLNLMYTEWSEGAATWNNSLDSTSWTAGGGRAEVDYALSPSATTSLSGGTKQFSSAQLILDVQTWMNHPELNFGWMLIATGEPTGTGKKVSSREAIGTEPVLTIVYSVPAPPPPLPTPPNIIAATLTGNAIRFSFNAQSNLAYHVEFLDSLSVSNWNVLTNISAQATDHIVNVTNTVSSPERYFRVRTP